MKAVMRVWLVTMFVVVLAVDSGGTQPLSKGVRLEAHTWAEAQALLQANAVVVRDVAILRECAM